MVTMRIILTIKADELKLAQLLQKFSEQYRITYTLKRQNGDFFMEVNTNDFSELQRRLNHLKDCAFKIQEMHGGRLLDKLNVHLTKTNIDALVGKTTIAKTDISPIDGGVVKLVGELWFCRPEGDEDIKEGTRVRVVGVEGVSLIVEEVK
jgi:membrane protein implicated in regulation of membrane protease activity